MSSAACHNMMTREDFLHRVVHSGEVTRIAQHLALVIFILSCGKSCFGASMRDLERITGWGKSTIRDHLSELEVFMKVTLGVGRGKTTFELQGVIEDALNAGLASGSRTQQSDATTEPAANSVRQPDTMADRKSSVQQQDASQDTKPDTNSSVREPDAAPDTSADDLSRAHACKENPSGLLSSRNDNNPPLSPQDDEPEPKPEESAKAKTKRGSRLPNDWRLPPEWRRTSAERFVITDAQITTEANAFRDYWTDLPGQKACKIEWLATWRNWLRKKYPERLVDVPEGSSKPWWQNPENLKAMTPDRWRRGIQQYANGIWHVEKLGPPPGHPKCVVPQFLISELRLTDIYTDGGIKRK